MVNELNEMMLYIHTSSSRPRSSTLAMTVLAEPEFPTYMIGFLSLSIVVENQSSRVESSVGTKMRAYDSARSCVYPGTISRQWVHRLGSPFFVVGSM